MAPHATSSPNGETQESNASKIDEPPQSLSQIKASSVGNSISPPRIESPYLSEANLPYSLRLHAELQPEEKVAAPLRTVFPPLEIEEHAIDEVRSLRVVVVGAGIAGITAGILLPAKVPGLDLTIYEKASDVVCILLIQTTTKPSYLSRIEYLS